VEITLREARTEDIPVCSEICSEAFTAISKKHGFPSDVPNAEVGAMMLTPMTEHPGFYGVVGELEGKVVGSNFLDERGEIVGLGPITVSVAGQNSGVGRLLMQHCLDRCEARQVQGVRLLQAAYHNRSLALYTRLGFDVQDVLSTLQGPAINRQIEGHVVRQMAPKDLSACCALYDRAHGHGRRNELDDAIQAGTATLVEQQGSVRGYFSSFGIGGFAVAETNEAIKALLGHASEFSGAGVLVPSGNGELMRWCMENGLKVVEQMTIMTKGFYQRPALPYLPSIFY
jgi:predicted N-acetyltransferase YhbS